MDTCNIAFCVSDNYIQYVCVTIKSIIENNKFCRNHVHIISDYISKNSEKRLYSLTSDKNYNLIITTHIIDDKILIGLKFDKWTKYAWYRILLPEILPEIDKILYLDADTLVVNSLYELFSIDIFNFSIAAVVDSSTIESSNRLGLPSSTYLCSGVIMINLNYWRYNKLTSKIIDWALKNKDILIFPDQDAINFICQDSYLKIPLKYNILPFHFLTNYFYQNFPLELKEAYLNPTIIHYSTTKKYKAWGKESKSYNRDLWIKYNNKLKWKAKITQEEAGFLALKIRIWNFLHRKQNNMRKEIEEKFAEYGIILY